MTKRINLWASPRNVSTAFMYSFAQRSDTTVVDEPLYAHYLSKTPADQYHPGAAETLATMEHDGDKVVAEMLGDYPTPVVFFKNMTHHLVELEWDFMLELENIIFTRHPRDLIPSFAKNVDMPTITDLGYAKQIEVLNYLMDKGKPPVVLESKELLTNPKVIMTKLCEALGIPFEEAMLSWEKGARPEDGSWAEHWYHSVHNSTGFAPYKEKTEPFPEHLKSLLAECEPYYEQLKVLALKI